MEAMGTSQVTVMAETIARACDAVRDATGFEDGSEIRTDRLCEALGTTKRIARNPGEADDAYLRRCDRHQMMLMGLIEKLRERLLEVHKVDLQANRRGAYVIVPRGQQAVKAADDGWRRARKELRDSMKRIENVDVDRLTHDQRVRREAAMLTTAHREQMLGGRGAMKAIDALLKKR